ncbi:MAG: AMP-binding protein [Deltaproteobacteria bacterium]|nr:AMP-binding protein [Deltaproteobacteria bacterium]
MTIPEEGTHHGALRDLARRRGADPCLLWREEAITFAELNARSDAFGAALQQLGIAGPDSVALMMGNRPEFLYAWFAVSKLGAVLVPVNTAHRGPILRHMLSIARCRAAVVEASYLPQVLGELESLPHLATIIVLGGEPPPLPDGREGYRFEDLLARGVPLESPPVWPKDPAIIMFTSGTTGPSKGALKSQNEGYQTARMAAESMDYGPADCLYVALPLFHGLAQVMGVLAALTSGARVLLVERFSASTFWEDIRRYGCTAALYVGTMISVLMKAERRAEDAENALRRMYGAGAPSSLWEEFERRFGVTLVEGYGMTEVGIVCLSLPGARKPGTCGKVQPTYDVKLVDEEGRTVPDGTPGELLVRPRLPNFFMLEYVGMPEKTVEAWRDLWFHTGDTLVRDEEGYYRFKDRKKEAIRRRGENISSFEVEQIVNRVPSVLESAAVGVPSDLGEEDVLVCVVPRPGHTINPEQLHRHCSESMAHFMVPRYIRVVERLPKTPTERVEKYRLKAEGRTADTWDAAAS